MEKYERLGQKIGDFPLSEGCLPLLAAVSPLHLSRREKRGRRATRAKVIICQERQ